MPKYTLFVDYLPKGRTERIFKPLELVEAAGEWAVSAMASRKADVLYPELADDVLIRVVGEQEPGRPIAEIRRPVSD